MGSWMLVWILCTTVTLMPVCLHGAISVHFKTGRLLYVALGETLVLEVVFKKDSGDKIDMVSWDRKGAKDNVRLSHGNRISLENGDTLLRVTDVAEEDIATYKVTVTDSNGYQQEVSIDVKNIVSGEPPKASITRVLECVVDNHGLAQWDSPQFSWLVDGVKVTNQSALLTNGSRLDISGVKGVNYTCIIKSSLGTLTTHFEMPTVSECCCAGLIAVGVITGIALVAGSIFLMKYKKISKHEAVSTKST